MRGVFYLCRECVVSAENCVCADKAARKSTAVCFYQTDAEFPAFCAPRAEYTNG